MDMSTETGYTRSAKHYDDQGRFLPRNPTDAKIQRLIPASVVGESVSVSGTTVGLLLTHQPHEARFQHPDYHRVSLTTNGREDGYVRIIRYDRDYDLTHTSHYLPEGSSERSILTSELSVPRVELTGTCTFERERMAVFLEEMQSCCVERGSTARMMSPRYIERWMDIEAPRRDYFKPAGLCLSGLSEEEYICSLREDCSLHLYSDRNIWVRHFGMDWPEYFFVQEKISMYSIHSIECELLATQSN